MSTFFSVSCIAHLPFPENILKMLWNIFAYSERCMLDRKPANMQNGMLVTRKYAINSSTYGIVDFYGILPKEEISGVIKKTIQFLYGMYFAKLANTAKKHVSEFTRACVNSIITGSE